MNSKRTFNFRLNVPFLWQIQLSSEVRLRRSAVGKPIAPAAKQLFHSSESAPPAKTRLTTTKGVTTEQRDDGRDGLRVYGRVRGD